MSALKVPLAMIRKYNQPGPRYTSYPPATHFSEAVLPSPLLEKLPTVERAPLSLYLHLPFCHSQCLYCGCTNIVTKTQSKSAVYLNYLEKEFALRAPLVAEQSPVVQIQLGGGTPTFLLPDEIRRLGQLIRHHFSVEREVEAGVEIDPRYLTLERVIALRAAGFNRASLGVQDTNPAVQKIIRRIQPIEQTAEAVNWLRGHGMTSINFDLIYGLPGQTPESFDATIDEVLALNPDRFAVYSYAHIPWIKPFQKIYEDRLPDTETKLRLLQLAIEKLSAAGYAYIGMDHFAKPDDAMTKALMNGTLQRNFQGYSTLKGVQLHGFGMSSISHTSELYFQNQKELAPYYAALDRYELPLMRGYIMTPEDRIRYEAIMHIMCNLYIDYSALSDQLGLPFETHFSEALQSLDDLEEDGLLKREAGGLRVTPLGRLFIRIIAMRFDEYLMNEQRKGRYSQTV
jgi:oxygen-independent coproporphyrinogen III oxidase